MTINSIEDFKKVLSMNVFFAMIITLLIAILSVNIIYWKHWQQTKYFNHKRIEAIVRLFSLSMSEKLAIVASSNVFVDFLRSGDLTRESLTPEFLYELKPIEDKEFSGMEILNSLNEPIFKRGVKSKDVLRLGLCYSDRFLDSIVGHCDFTWVLYLRHKKVLNALKAIDENVSTCARCTAINLVTGKKFGSFPITGGSEIFVKIKYDNEEYMIVIWMSALIFLMIVFLAFWVWLKIKIIVNRVIAEPLKKLTSKVEDSSIIIEPEIIQEFRYLDKEIDSWKNKLEIIKTDEKNAEIGKLTSQIIHDIRTPISIISKINGKNHGLSDNEKIIFKQAVSMLSSTVSDILDIQRSGNSIKNTTPESLSLLLVHLHEEFNIKLIGSEINIELIIHDDAYSGFVEVDQNIFKRVISNIINNAVDSFENISLNNKRNIKITVDRQDEMIVTRISDNGCGITNDLIGKITEGGYTSKKAGHGLGVAFAKNMISAWNGNFLVESKEGKGTDIIISLPLRSASCWFQDGIYISIKGKCIILDDEEFIHQIWRNKLGSMEPSRVLSFYRIDDFSSFIKSNKIDGDIMLFVDYDLCNPKSNGIDLIQQYNLINKSFLVTNKYDDHGLLNRVNELGIKLIPKCLVPIIPVKQKSSKKYLLLDDNEVICRMWEMQAKENGYQLVAFNDVQKFLKKVNDHDVNTVIFIDYEINNNITGFDVAKELYLKGFENLYIITGHVASYLSKPHFIKGIRGKEFDIT